MGSSFRVGLYARVSTHDQHTLSLPLEARRTYATQHDRVVVIQVTEIGSGTVAAAARAGSAHARQPGQPHDRPPAAFRHAAQIGQLCTEGLSTRAIACHLGLGSTAVRRILQVTGVCRDDTTPAKRDGEQASAGGGRR